MNDRILWYGRLPFFIEKEEVRVVDNLRITSTRFLCRDVYLS